MDGYAALLLAWPTSGLWSVLAGGTLHVIPSGLGHDKEHLQKWLSFFSCDHGTVSSTLIPSVFSIRLSIKALDMVLCKCIDEKWTGILRKQRTWAFLENPQTHHEGMCLLTR